MFQFPRSPPGRLCVRQPGARPSPGGFPHSGTPGSKAACASPGNIAARRALLRLPVPRHPPCAHGTPRLPARGAGGYPPPVWCSLFDFDRREVHRVHCRASLCGSQGARGLPRRAGCREGWEVRGRPPARRGVAPAASTKLSELVFLSDRPSGLPRKEVIQPHLPVRLPCYDFTPLTLHTFGASPLAVGPATSGADDSGGVTGGVYKARERIHRGVLIRDY